MERLAVLRSGNQITIPVSMTQVLTPVGKHTDAFRIILNPNGVITLIPVFIDKKKEV